LLGHFAALCCKVLEFLVGQSDELLRHDHAPRIEDEFAPAPDDALVRAR
jgi:hypothetical protein